MHFQVNTLKYYVLGKGFTFFMLLLVSAFHAAQMHRQETVRIVPGKRGAGRT